jgi:hypothetical protein
MYPVKFQLPAPVVPITFPVTEKSTVPAAADHVGLAVTSTMTGSFTDKPIPVARDEMLFGPVYVAVLAAASLVRTLLIPNPTLVFVLVRGMLWVMVPPPDEG